MKFSDGTSETEIATISIEVTVKEVQYNNKPITGFLSPEQASHLADYNTSELNELVTEESVLHVTALFVEGLPLKVKIIRSGSLLGISQ